MYILGLGGSNHDFSSCLLKDGEILSIIEEERITRKKHGIGLGVSLAKGLSVKYCCEAAGIEFGDIDLVIGNEILNKVMYRRMQQEVILINHHLAHAASCFYPSPFQDAAILVADSVGSKKLDRGECLYESVSFAVGNGNEIHIKENISGRNMKETDLIENSLGIFYSVITQIIGFGEHQEGKTMGLAPYGTNKYYHLMKQHIRCIGDGRIEMKEEDIRQLFTYKDIIDTASENKKAEIKADFAYAAQQVLEECMLYLCRHLKKLTNKKTLCLAGGIALNSVANYRIYKEKIFEQIFIQPACGDNGTSIGSALYGHYAVMGQKRNVGRRDRGEL